MIEAPYSRILACHDHDDQQIEARIAQTVDERFRRQMDERFRRQIMEEDEVIVAAEMNDPVDSTFCGVVIVAA
jgi:hypothetical protein